MEGLLVLADRTQPGFLPPGTSWAHGPAEIEKPHGEPVGTRGGVTQQKARHPQNTAELSLAARPWSCFRIACTVGTYGDGSSKMQVVSSEFRSLRDAAWG
jgi:hypothetical protein